MIRRLLVMGVRGYVGGPAKSWVFTTSALVLWRMLSRATAKNELIDLSDSKPGDRFTIRHLDITRKQQIKDLKRAKKADKATAKMVRRDQRAAKKLARQS